MTTRRKIDPPPLAPDFEDILALKIDDNLRRLLAWKANLRDGMPLEPADAEFLIEALDLHIQRILPLSESLALDLSARQPPAETERQDEMIRELRKTVPKWSKLSDRAAALSMFEDARAYEAGRWRFDRSRTSPPSDAIGAVWYRLLISGRRIPGDRRLRKIFGGP